MMIKNLVIGSEGFVGASLCKFLTLITEEDIDHIMSKEHRYSWFENLEKRPIRLKKGTAGINGKKINSLIKGENNKTNNYKKYLQPKKYLNYIKRKIFDQI